MLSPQEDSQPLETGSRDRLPVKVELKFASVYESPAWKQLEEVDRAQLMLVAEGAKPGAIIGGNHTFFLDILHTLGLECVLTSDPHRLAPAYLVAHSDWLSQYLQEVLSVPENAQCDIFDRINGRFLGYPECCTEEYCNPKLNLSERKKLSPRKFLSNIDFELSQEIDRTGTYPEELDYCPMTFTPCSIQCQPASKMLRQYMNILKAGDPEAAGVLQRSNWYDTPCMSVHQAEFDELLREATVKWHIEKLRRSVMEWF